MLTEFRTLSSAIIGKDLTVRESLTARDITTQSVQFDISQTNIPETGQLIWNAEENTLRLGLNNDVDLDIGEENIVDVKATEIIKRGQCVYASGAVGGGSGHIEVSLYKSQFGFTNEIYFLGVAAQDLNANDFGYATTFGKIREVLVSDTRGSDDPQYGLSVNDGWEIGTILYPSVTDLGKYTQTRPSAPNRALAVAMIIDKNGNKRIFYVRSEHGYDLSDLHDIKITNPQDKQILTYNKTLSTWENKSDITVTSLSATTIHALSSFVEVIDIKQYELSGFNVKGDATVEGRVGITDITSAGSGSLSGSALDIAQTWNTTGTPTAIKLDVTDTASNASSLLMDLQVGGVSKANIKKTGSVYFASSVYTPTSFVPTQGMYNAGFDFELNSNGLKLGSSQYLAWYSAKIYNTQDLVLVRDAANTLAQRNDTNPQEFRLYGTYTYTDASNYERLSLKANAGGAFTITSEAAGTGSVRDIALMGGNVGIGTTTPTQKIDVLDGQIISTSSSNAHWWVKMYQTSSEGRLQSGGNLEIMCGNGANIFIKKHNTTVLTVAANDNVGIGTTAPSAKLSILDTALAGSAALSGSALDIAQTWNTTGTPTAIKLNVTDTASNASSLLMDLQVGGVSKVKVDKNGNLIYPQTATGIWFSDNAVHSGIRNNIYGLAGFEFVANASRIASVLLNGINFANGKYIGFRSDNSLHVDSATRIYSDANHVIAQRNGTNAQEFRLYNTYTDASNYERLAISSTTGGSYAITSEAGGTGTVRDIALMGGNVGIGTTAPSSKLDIFNTSTQLRLSYDISNFSTFETGSTGNLTIQPSGSYIFVTSKRIAFGTGGGNAFLDQSTEGEIRIRNVSNNDFRNLKLKNLNATGDIESETIGNGVIIKSPNGTRWRITVDDTGALITTAL